MFYGKVPKSHPLNWHRIREEEVGRRHLLVSLQTCRPTLKEISYKTVTWPDDIIGISSTFLEVFRTTEHEYSKSVNEILGWRRNGGVFIMSWEKFWGHMFTWPQQPLLITFTVVHDSPIDFMLCYESYDEPYTSWFSHIINSLAYKLFFAQRSPPSPISRFLLFHTSISWA